MRFVRGKDCEQSVSHLISNNNNNNRCYIMTVLLVLKIIALGSENDEKTSEETTTGLVEGYDEVSFLVSCLMIVNFSFNSDTDVYSYITSSKVGYWSRDDRNCYYQGQ